MLTRTCNINIIYITKNYRVSMQERVLIEWWSGMTTSSLTQSPGWTTWVRVHAKAALGISLEALTQTNTTLFATSKLLSFTLFCLRFILTHQIKTTKEAPSFHRTPCAHFSKLLQTSVSHPLAALTCMTKVHKGKRSLELFISI